ncbi:MAG: GreA/GreB family elongation factor [Bacteroidia bacterium]
MKPIISKTDFNTLHELIVKQPNGSGKNLGEGITKAHIVEEKEIDKQTVRLNSFVEVTEVSSKKSMKMQIVMPDFADIKQRRISVFAPISVALLGFKESDMISWVKPEGEANFKIIKVINE